MKKLIIAVVLAIMLSPIVGMCQDKGDSKEVLELKAMVLLERLGKIEAQGNMLQLMYNNTQKQLEIIIEQLQEIEKQTKS